jgi:hypothetical protein
MPRVIVGRHQHELYVARRVDIAVGVPQIAERHGAIERAIGDVLEELYTQSVSGSTPASSGFM